MCGESSVAKGRHFYILSDEMLKQGVMAGAIVFPMVARDKALMSALDDPNVCRSHT